MLNKIRSELLNFGLKFISIDEKIVRMILETSPSNINELVILPAIKPVMKKIINKMKNKASHGRVYNGLLNGIQVSVIRSHIGAPNTAMIVECLRRSKAKIIIRVDVCGGISTSEAKVNIGDILIPKLAYCDDGTSPHYLRSFPSLINQCKFVPNPLANSETPISGNTTVFKALPNRDLVDLILGDAFAKYGNRIKEIDLWTMDALFCETVEFVQAIRELNVSGIDMESSILFLLGTLYNLKTVSILSVSDLPGDSNYDLLQSNQIHPNMEKGIDDSIQLLFNTLPKMINLLN
jgi:purine-nucleoside phosphorylase